MFLAMLVPRLVDRPTVVAAVAGAVTSASTVLVLPDVAVLTGTLAGVTAAMLARRGRTT